MLFTECLPSTDQSGGHKLGSELNKVCESNIVPKLHHGVFHNLWRETKEKGGESILWLDLRTVDTSLIFRVIC
jgi:hypothetical protein